MPKWNVSRGGPQWLMDAEERVIGYRDRRGAEWVLSQQSRAFGSAELAVMPGGSVVTGLIEGDPAAAAANTALAQAALLRRGRVEFLAPGIYQLNATLTAYSQTQIVVGADVSLKMVNGSSGGIFTNYAARITPTTVAVGDATYAVAPDGNNFVIVCTNMAGAGLRFPVGSYVSAVALGHGALGAPGVAINNRGYRGVWRVVASSANSISYETRRLYPGSNNNTTPIFLYPADENISIVGPGTLDGNGPGINQVLFKTGDPRGNLVWMRHAMNVTLDGFQVKRGITWTLGSNYVRSYTVRDVSGDTRDGAVFDSIDVVHLSGQHQKVLIDNVVCASADNLVGMTIDCTEGTVYDFPYQQPGEMFDVTVKNTAGVCVSEDGFFGIVGVYGPEAYGYHDIVVDDAGGSGSAVVQIANYAPTNQNRCTIDSLRVQNVRGVFSGPAVIIDGGAHAIGSLVIDGAKILDELAPVFKDNSVSGSIENLVISNVQYKHLSRTAVDRTGPLVELGNLNIKNISINNIVAPLAAGVPLSVHVGSGVIGRLVFRGVSATSAGGAGSALHAVTGSGACTTLVFDGCSFNGTTSSGAMFLQGPNSAYALVVFNNPVVAAAQGLFVGQNVNAAISVFINSLTMGSGASACAYAGIFAGPTSLFLNGYAEVLAPTNNPFQCLTAAKLYNFRFENVGRDADSITKTAGTLRFHGLGARTAIANVDAPQTGDIVYNITGTVRVARNIANNAWVSLHT